MKRHYYYFAVALALFYTLALSIMPGTQANAGQPPAAQSNPIYMFGRINAKVTISQKGRKEKYERRTYITPLFEVSRADFDKYHLGSTVQLSYAWKNLADYFNNTVNKAAESRGEDLEASGSDIRVWNNAALGARMGDDFVIKPKETIEKARDEEIKNAKDDERTVIIFNWDPTGKNVDKDLEREMKGIPVQRN